MPVPIVDFNSNQPANWQTDGLQSVPSTPQPILGVSSSLAKLVVSNISGIQQTASLVDGNGMQVFPAVAVQPNTVLVVDLGGVRAKNGCSWFASNPNAIQAWLRGSY
jgi:hypothetical protein